MSTDIQKAIQQIAEEKNLSTESIIETIEAALAVAYRKDFGEKDQNIVVEFEPPTGQSQVFDEKTVTDKIPEPVVEIPEGEEEKPAPRVFEKKNEHGEVVELSEEERPFDPRREITLADAQKLKPGAVVGDVIRTELEVPAAYGRMAAQTAKQVIIQKLREAERQMVYEEFKDKHGTLITGNVQRQEGRLLIVDLGRATGLVPPKETIYGERLSPGQRIKFYIVAVNQTPKGPEILLSRSHPDMVKVLFTMEVPEIEAGTVEIKEVAREAGLRTKIAVVSHDSNIDPVGSCVGQRGTRVQTVISELGGEKIDIIEYNEDPVKFIVNALSPAKVLSVKLYPEEKRAEAEVKEDQLSLAIGKSGQNVRLSAKLTGWKIDILKEDGTSAAASKENKEKTEDAGESAEEAVASAEQTPDISEEPKAAPIAEETTVEKSEEKPAEETTPSNES